MDTLCQRNEAHEGRNLLGSIPNRIKCSRKAHIGENKTFQFEGCGVSQDTTDQL